MSSPRITKLWEGLAEQLHRQGYAGTVSKQGIALCIKWIGRDAAGKDACVVDLDSATWASGNRRAIIVATAAGTKPTDFADFHTQSHAAGHQIDGSVSLTCYMEAPAAHTDAQARFERELLHVLRGQLGAPISLQLTANGTEPTVNGANGAGATAATTDAGDYLPYGMAVSGGI